jgi:hypothetical protein
MMKAFHIIIHIIFAILIRLRGSLFTIHEGLPEGIASSLLGE